MSEDEFKQYQLNIANAKRRSRANLLSRIAEQASFVEPGVSNAPLEAQEVQGRSCERILVRVTSIRNRLLDEDNLCEKYHVDLCRYAGALPDDAPDKVKIEVCQRKAAKGERERTEIVINETQKLAVRALAGGEEGH